jgi:uncharacterized Fe-S cluster-containing radical SAM superfamily protein
MTVSNDRAFLCSPCYEYFQGKIKERDTKITSLEEEVARLQKEVSKRDKKLFKLSTVGTTTEEIAA